MVLKNKLFWQIIRFGLVGSLAAATQLTVVMTLVEMGLLQPLAANIVGFMIAFQVSYWGHRHWTFNAIGVQHSVAVPRLFFIASSGFIANELFFYIMMSVFHLPYIPALLVVLTILPTITFISSKFWVFR
jgi:putative flippase GtrA